MNATACGVHKDDAANFTIHPTSINLDCDRCRSIAVAYVMRDQTAGFDWDAISKQYGEPDAAFRQRLQQYRQANGWG